MMDPTRPREGMLFLGDHDGSPFGWALCGLPPLWIPQPPWRYGIHPVHRQADPLVCRPIVCRPRDVCFRAMVSPLPPYPFLNSLPRNVISSTAPYRAARLTSGLHTMAGLCACNG